MLILSGLVSNKGAVIEQSLGFGNFILACSHFGSFRLYPILKNHLSCINVV